MIGMFDEVFDQLFGCSIFYIKSGKTTKVCSQFLSQKKSNSVSWNVVSTSESLFLILHSFSYRSIRSSTTTTSTLSDKALFPQRALPFRRDILRKLLTAQLYEIAP